MPRILVVEDEEEISAAIRDWLVDEHHLVEIVSNGKEALSRLSSASYDLIILDLLLPEVGGMDVCRRYREGNGRAPILMLTAKRSLDSKEAGLDAGADDYLTKPFHMRELSARVRALLRRPVSAPSAVFQIGDLLLDRNACRLTKSGQEIHLLPKEFSLLELLMRNKNTVLATDVLIDQVWGADGDIVPETVRSYIKTLRKKIDTPDCPSLIRTVHGTGYIIEDM